MADKDIVCISFVNSGHMVSIYTQLHGNKPQHDPRSVKLQYFVPHSTLQIPCNWWTFIASHTFLIITEVTSVSYHTFLTTNEVTSISSHTSLIINQVTYISSRTSPITNEVTSIPSHTFLITNEVTTIPSHNVSYSSLLSRSLNTCKMASLSFSNTYFTRLCVLSPGDHILHTYVNESNTLFRSYIPRPTATCNHHVTEFVSP
jgi:hypothetical protein